MARMNVYVPDELAREWRRAGRLSLSQVTQVAMGRELARSDTDRWLQRVTVLRGWVASHEEAMRALGVARAVGDP